MDGNEFEIVGGGGGRFHSPPADQREIFPRTIPVGSVGREDILYCDYRSGSDVRRMMRLF